MQELLTTLAQKRPIFHSEADFQHELAWLWHKIDPDAEIRLEFPVRMDGRSEHVDVLYKSPNEQVAVELKYKTRAIACTYNDEKFNLANHSAQDVGRYDFIKDIMRLERLVQTHPDMTGYAIFLSNDSAYWSAPRPSAPVDAAFRLTAGRKLSGPLSWDPRASPGTRRGREQPLTLSGNYTISWTDYSCIECPRYAAFKCAVLKIENSQQAKEPHQPVTLSVQKN